MLTNEVLEQIVKLLNGEEVTVNPLSSGGIDISTTTSFSFSDSDLSPFFMIQPTSWIQTEDDAVRTIETKGFVILNPPSEALGKCEFLSAAGFNTLNLQVRFIYVDHHKISLLRTDTYHRAGVVCPVAVVKEGNTTTGYIASQQGAGIYWDGHSFSVVDYKRETIDSIDTRVAVRVVLPSTTDDKWLVAKID